MRTIDAMKKLARNDGRFTHVYTKKELSELFNETGSKLNGTLKSLIKENILNRAYHNVYVFRFSQYGGLGTLDLIGKKIRPNDSFYESLESSASAWSLISQIPTVVTYMTTGKSKWYNTGYGSIDFVHYSKTDEKPRTIDRSSMGRVPLADKLQTYRDLQKTKRSLDLLREQYDKDHGCRDGNIQYYPCEDDDTWDFLDNLEEDMLYTQRHLLDAIHPKSDENYHWHGVDIAKIKRLPQLLETPVLLCDSPARNDVLLAVLKCVDNDRLPMIAAIKPDGNGIYQLTATESNFILSVYGKNEFDLYFEQRITPERIVFYDKEKGRDLERLVGIQFPEYYSKLATNTIIQNHLCICNRGNKPVSSAANPSLEQRKEYMRPIQEMKSLIFHCK